MSRHDQLDLDAALSRLTDAIADVVRHIAADVVQDMWDQRWQAANHVEGALRLAHVSEVLDISESSVRRLVDAGELTTVDITGIAHVTHAEIRRYLADLERDARRVRAVA